MVAGVVRSSVLDTKRAAPEKGDPIHYYGDRPPMSEKLPDTEAGIKSGAIASAPTVVRRHGIQGAHTQPLVAELEDGELRSGRTSPAKASEVDAAVGRLHDAGGHLVATIYRNEPKRIRRPIWERWPERRIAPDAAAAHLRSAPDHGLGIIPASIESAVADLDAGSRAELWEAVGEPWASLTTRRGSHSWYDDDGASLTRWSFNLGECRGELLGERAFLPVPRVCGDRGARGCAAPPWHGPVAA